MTSLITKSITAIAISIIAVLVPTTVGAKTIAKLPNAAQIFAEAPDSIVPLLTHNTRLDMLDYFHSNIDRASSNNYGGQSQVLAEDSCQVTIDMSPATEMQIAKVSGKAGDIIIVIESISTPAVDSQVRFFNADWTPVKSSPLNLSINLWLSDTDSDTRADILRELPFMLAAAKFDSDTQSITFTNSLGDYYAKDYQPKWLDKIKPSLTFRYDGKRFNLIP